MLPVLVLKAKSTNYYDLNRILIGFDYETLYTSQSISPKSMDFELQSHGGIAAIQRTGVAWRSSQCLLQRRAVFLNTSQT